MLLSASALADSQNQQDGSLNTNNVDSTVNSNNTTEDKSVSNVYNGAGSSSEMPVGSAIAPSYMSSGVDTCLEKDRQEADAVLCICQGGYKEDETVTAEGTPSFLSDLGMKVAAVARMCESEEVWLSMFKSGTLAPCYRMAS